MIELTHTLDIIIGLTVRLAFILTVATLLVAIIYNTVIEIRGKK